MKYPYKKKKIIFVIGPTATGKSRLAIKLARKIGGEIVSCDSMQVYKGLDIINCKPSRAERKEVKHHLIGIVSQSQNFNVSKFIKISQQLIGAIHKRGKIPIFVGGTGLYMDSLLNGIFDGPQINPGIRNGLYRKAKVFGGDYLYKRLKDIDPQTAEKVHPHDLRRIVRALEVYKVTRKPISKLRKQRKGILKDRSLKIYIFGLDMSREKLYEKINKRVDIMFKKGALLEVRRILKKRCSKTFKQALGIKEIDSYLKGKITLDKAKELLKRNTRRYAKRQIAWFKNNPRIHWLKNSIFADTKKIVKEITHEPKSHARVLASAEVRQHFCCIDGISQEPCFLRTSGEAVS